MGSAHFPGDFDFSGPEATRGPDGRIAFQPWTATTHSLSQLREFGLDPSSERAERAVELIGANARWEEGGQPYWDGEVEPCINGMTVANGSYFGVDVSSIVERLVSERLDDGGWNCETEIGSVRSSFATTINVLEGSWSSNGQPVAPASRGRRAARVRSTSWSGRSFAVSARVSRPTSDSWTSFTRTDGTTTCSGGSTTSALPPPSPARASSFSVTDPPSPRRTRCVHDLRQFQSRRTPRCANRRDR